MLKIVGYVGVIRRVRKYSRKFEEVMQPIYKNLGKGVSPFKKTNNLANSSAIPIEERVYDD